jgi:hypothetical protein
MTVFASVEPQSTIPYGAKRQPGHVQEWAEEAGEGDEEGYGNVNSSDVDDRRTINGRTRILDVRFSKQGRGAVESACFRGAPKESAGACGGKRAPTAPRRRWYGAGCPDPKSERSPQSLFAAGSRLGCARRNTAMKRVCLPMTPRLTNISVDEFASLPSASTPAWSSRWVDTFFYRHMFYANSGRGPFQC